MPKAKRRPPTAKPPVLFARSQKVLQQLEKQVGCPVLSYWSSNAGSVCEDDVVVLHEHCRSLGTGLEDACLFIKSSGGSGRNALRIIHVLRQHVRRLRVLVPLECASAATMMALGADEVHMGPLAFLTAVDTSIRHELSPNDIDNELVSVSQDELGRVVRLWLEHGKKGAGDNPVGALMPYVHPLVIGAVDRSSSLSIRLCQEILSYHTEDPAVVERIAHELNSSYPSHDYPITLPEAQRIGLPAVAMDSAVNELLLELHAIYSEMGQRSLTDYDEQNYHNNEIATITERKGGMLLYQINKDWHYRQEERRWTALNDKSAWLRIRKVGARLERSTFHIR